MPVVEEPEEKVAMMLCVDFNMARKLGWLALIW
jgi:hypothetical protein